MLDKRRRGARVARAVVAVARGRRPGRARGASGGAGLLQRRRLARRGGARLRLGLRLRRLRPLLGRRWRRLLRGGAGGLQRDGAERRKQGVVRAYERARLDRRICVGD